MSARSESAVVMRFDISYKVSEIPSPFLDSFLLSFSCI